MITPEPLAEYSLVSAPPKKPRPYWLEQAEAIASKYPSFSQPLLHDWQRVVKRTKANGIRTANERMDAIIKQFKFGDYRIDQTDDQTVNDYANAKSEQCIKLLAGWMLGHGTMPAGAEQVAPLLEYHGLDTTKLDDLDNITGLQSDANKMTAEIQEATVGLSALSKRVRAMPYRPRTAPRWSVRMAQRHVSRHQNHIDELTAKRDRKESKANQIPNDCRALLMRVQDPKWWIRKIRRVSAQRTEAISRELGTIHRTSSMYCSRLGRAEYRRRKQLNLNMMENTVLENDNGDQYTLADLAELSNANPAIRRTELMIRVAGFEQYAKQLGYEGWFYTVTCPGAYHAYVTSKRKDRRVSHRNPNFNGTTQREAQQHLCKVWAKFRAKAKRNDWRFFGVRVAEPHHDGTPHWHLLLFIHPDDANKFGGALKEYAMEALPDERGADEHRFDVEKIKTGTNPNTGNEYSAAGYIAKYISKSIDGEHIDADLYNEDAKTSAESIVVWASRNGIRQFQQIGGPSVSGWREFRRLARQSPECIDALPPLVREATKQIEHINQTDGAATAWAWYCRHCDEHGKVSLWRIVKTAIETIEAISEESGEVYEINTDKPIWNQYNELIEKDNGIRAMWDGQELHVQTRMHNWTSVSCTPSEAEEVRTRRKAERAGREAAALAQREARAAVKALAPPWTGVNNCTGAAGSWPPIPPGNQPAARKTVAAPEQTTMFSQ
ncbi:replication endonuclease [Oceanobacter sp. 4_MG-2023]|uniref:replication endonuclease n=1 Tax=Oceanobacter sp. 4_MG-2023 TaxID=3062623 RepID=UPI002733A00A|nr:replication endonuclease [Oceanobacter sp. 4_MG-2023]MDP2548879.1 replication endonuclease [Oceanobacter sp. 4_MG-2023]